VFDVGGDTIDKIKHSVRPQIFYDFIPNVDQDDLAEFDFIDRIDKKSLITYSLTNTLTSKSRKRVSTTTEHREDKSPGNSFDRPSAYNNIRGGAIDDPSDYSYNDFLRLKLEQSYDLNKSKRAFSPIFAKLAVFPKQYFSIDAEAGWSVYDNSFVSRNIAATFWDKRGDRLFIEYRQNKKANEIDDDIGAQFDKTESIFTDLTVKVADRLAVFADYERNFVDEIDIRRSLGFFYQAPCWSFNFRFVQKPDNYNLEFRINLSGLGGIGF